MSLQNESKMSCVVVVLVLLFCLSQSSVAQTPVPGGPVKGEWNKAGNPYFIGGDIWIDSGESLTIKPGVEVVFSGAYTFTINGLLKANGRADDTITIHARSAPGVYVWKQIYYTESAKPGCILTYCVIKDSGYHESTEGDRPAILIYNNDTNVTISHSEIYNNDSWGIQVLSYLYTNGGDYITKKCRPTITNNSIHDNGKDGIYVYAKYQNISSGFRTWANYNISIASPLIKRNSIYSNGTMGIRCRVDADGGQYNSEYYCDYDPIIQANPTIQQNTIYDNGIDAIICYKDIKEYFCGIVIIEANPVITSNIISGFNRFALNANNEVNVQNVRYNDFWDEDFWRQTKKDSTFNGIDGGLGEIVKDNFNGHPCDIMWNIFFDPEFVDAANYDFHLKSTSKCINAGDPGLPWDADSSFPDIGALPYSPTTAVHENRAEIPNAYALDQNYPNPFNPETVIAYQLSTAANVELVIYNMLGQKIRTLVSTKQNAGYHHGQWDGRNDAGVQVSSGAYLYQLKAGNFLQIKKMLLVR